MELLIKPSKPISQAGKILQLLKRNRKYGVYNYELVKIALCYSKRIQELREEGWNIQAVRIKGGTWKYYLNQEKEATDSN